jgi:transcriptional regulator with XRE-family HTH domain
MTSLSNQPEPADRARGARIRRARKALKLSQKDLARELGVSRVAVTQWEGGEMPDARRWPTLVNILRIGLDNLILGEVSAEPVPVVGYVGAGAEVFLVDDLATGQRIDDAPPFPGQKGPAVAVRVRGDSMLPQIEDGWTLYYAADQSAGVVPDAVNRLSVVQVHDGPMLVKKLEPGRKKNLWRLVSFNASPRDDVRLDWAARVLAIVP